MKNTKEKYFIQEHLFRDKIYHGGIGNKDIEKILLDQGFHPIKFPCHFDFSLKAKIIRAIFLFQCLWTIRANSVIVFQWPLYAKMHQIIISLCLLFRRSLQIVCFITDIDGIRDDNDFLLKKEISFFRKCKYFIVHNNAMKCWLQKINPSAVISVVEFFDFLAVPNRKSRSKSFAVTFSGNDESSKFVYELRQIANIKFHLYGKMVARYPNDNRLIFHGCLEPTTLVEKIEGAFGLVWNGDDINFLSGKAGRYLYLNSPHKLSSYIISGLPVIVHEKAAVAYLVNRYKVGFTVSSLDQLEKKIKMLDERSYHLMQNNCFWLAEKIAKGHGLKTALQKMSII